jgi:hypothetical protein
MALGAWRFGHKAQVQFHTYSKDLPKYQVLIGIPITEPARCLLTSMAGL